MYGDRLVARFDPRLDRAQKTLMINGVWLEDAAAADDPAFVQAWVRGLARFATFVGAEQVNLQGMGVMRPQTEACIKETDGLLATSRWPLAV